MRRYSFLPVLFPLALTLALLHADPLPADETDGRLDIYFIDTEGGAATLIVTPAGESLLYDSGYPTPDRRDLERILHVVREVAGREHLDYAGVSHWHIDHYGNHAAVAAEIPIHNFFDRGVPDELPGDRGFNPRQLDPYRAATQNQSRTVHPGDTIPMTSGDTPLTMTIVTASREVIENTGEPNPHADKHQPAREDTSDNAASVSWLLKFGEFTFLCCGDLTWNIEAELVTPNNPLGKVDLFMVTHHGLSSSNNPVLVHAIDPIVAVMCNGPRKGGALQTIETLRGAASLEHWYQLHRNVQLSAEEQAPPEFIANMEPTENCEGVWVKASVAPDGESYTVQIGPDGELRTYQTRDDH